MTHYGSVGFCERLGLSGSIFDYSGPRDSGPCAFWDRKNNLWVDDNGVVLNDLKDMGFSARMRETILIYIRQHDEDQYVGLVNDYGDAIELFWQKEN